MFGVPEAAFILCMVGAILVMIVLACMGMVAGLLWVFKKFDD